MQTHLFSPVHDKKKRKSDKYVHTHILTGHTDTHTHTWAQLHVSFDHNGGPQGFRGTAGQKCTGRGVPTFYSVFGGRRAPHRKPAIHEIIQRVTERGSRASAHLAGGEGRGAGWRGLGGTHSIRPHLYDYSMWIAPECPVLTGFEFLTLALTHSLLPLFFFLLWKPLAHVSPPVRSAPLNCFPRGPAQLDTGAKFPRPAQNS